MRYVLSIFVIAFFSFSASGDVICIDANGMGDYATIQAGIDDANTGDVIVLQPGVYTGAGNRDIDFLGKAITVQSSDPNDPCVVAATVIDCGGSEDDPHRGFIFQNGEDNDSILYGLTVINGYSPGRGGGIYLSGSRPIISNCTISNCAAYDPEDFHLMHGGGIYCDQSNPIITHCTITENLSGGGGAIYCNNISNARIRNCMITDNSGGSFGGGIRCWESSPVISRCTVSGNSASAGGGICYGSHCYLSIDNCILWGNTGGEIVKSTSASVSITVSYSDVKGGFRGTGNIDSNPFYLNSDSGNYHIAADSNCIDAGDPGYAGIGEVDIDGDQRIVNLRVDIGADEYTTGPAVMEIIPKQFAFAAEEDCPNVPCQMLYINNRGEGQVCWTIQSDCNWLSAIADSGVTIDEPNEVEIVVDVNGLTHGTYQGVLSIADPNASNSPQTVTVNLSVNKKLLVPSKYGDIQSAIDAAIDGDTVLVSDGVHTGSGNRDIDFLGKAITVKSENGPDSCIIDCNGNEGDNHRGFYFVNNEGVDSVLEGFTITNAFVAVMCDGGAGIHIRGASPTIKNCIITNNHAELCPESLCFCQGGSVYVGDGGRPVFSNCVISENSVGAWGMGGGVYCGYFASGVTLQNCLIVNNTALEYSSSGGGVYCSSSDLNLYNCTIVDNHAADEGGGVFISFSSNVSIGNTIIWGNSPDQIHFMGVGDVSAGSNYIADDLAVAGGYNDDPCFVDPNAGNYHLSRNSPFIDLGNNSQVPTELTKDLDGRDRIVDGDCNGSEIVDMGAYEFSYVYLGDFAGGCDVNFDDFVVFALSWLADDQDTGYNRDCDISFPIDGVIDENDLQVFSDNWLLSN